MRLRLTAAVLAVLVGWLAAIPAAGTTVEKRARITSNTVEDGVLTMVLRTDGLVEGETVDVDSVTVNFLGQRLDATARPLDSGRVAVVRTAVLAIDNSRSMAGAKLEAAKSAAVSFIESLPSDVTVGLVTFASGTQVRVENTPDREAVLDAIDQISLDPTRGTALFDGTAVAADVTGADGSRTVVLLTDGNEDGSSRLSLEGALGHINDDGVTLDAVYIGEGGQAQPPELVELLDRAGGRVVTSGTADLADVFKQTAAAISSEILITAPLPPGEKGASNAFVAAIAGGTPVSDQTFVSLTPTRQQGPARDLSNAPRPVDQSLLPFLESRTTLFYLLGAAFVGTAIALLAAFAGRRDGERGRVRRRLSLYTLGIRPTVQPQTSTILGANQVARTAVEFAGRLAQRRDFEARLGLRLESAGVPLRAAEWMIIHVGVAIGVALALLLISGGTLIATFLGLIIGLAIPLAYLVIKESRRTTAFLAQLPDTLQLIAGSLSAGYSVPQAIDAVVQQGNQPITGEFNRALVEARLGVPIEEALDGVAERMQSKDFAWVVMAIQIQREIGGNLAELLTTVAATLRERERLRRQVSALSAEGRLSAWILGLLPPVFVVYLVLVRPEYLRPLVTEPAGWLLVGLGISLLAVGTVWMRKAVRVEV